MAAATVDLTEAQYDVADRIELAMEADPDTTWTPSALARKVRADYDDVVTVLRWLVAGQYGVTTCGKGGAWTRYCLTEHKRENARRAVATPQELVALATDNPEVLAAVQADAEAQVAALRARHARMTETSPGTVRAAERVPTDPEPLHAAIMDMAQWGRPDPRDDLWSRLVDQEGYTRASELYYDAARWGETHAPERL